MFSSSCIFYGDNLDLGTGILEYTPVSTATVLGIYEAILNKVRSTVNAVL